MSLVEEDLTSLMGSITGSRNVYPRHFFWAQAYFDGLGIETTISGLPPMEMIEGEPLSTIEGDVGEPVAPLTIVYTVPEPTALALLAIGVGVLMRRRKSRA